MSSRRFRFVRTVFLLVALLLTGSVGCWEQWSNDWFPQMKWQPAVQAFERVEWQGRLEGFLPPEGTVPITGGEADNSKMTDDEAATLVNPRRRSLASLQNGKAQYEIYCITCHGESGLGDGPVSMTGEIAGPFIGVLPIAGPASVAKVRSEGHIYNSIRYGRRRMPAYRRISSEDRWDIVNYVMYINQPGVDLW
ncbi:MAG: cytochrome c [Deltaproteobacteria bacterium]|nr:cytochrome c [Deltaproteobacteria bacterium]MBW2399721.1 cytochrome c [Deltaproteobacteria bacterium]